MRQLSRRRVAFVFIPKIFPRERERELKTEHEDVVVFIHLFSVHLLFETQEHLLHLRSKEEYHKWRRIRG